MESFEYIKNVTPYGLATPMIDTIKVTTKSGYKYILRYAKLTDTCAMMGEDFKRIIRIRNIKFKR